jgi:uncharacterized protein YggE
MKSKSILIALAILPFLLFGQPPQAQDMGNAGYKKNLATNHPRLTDPPRAQDPSINQQFFNIKINALYNRKADAQLAIFNLVQMGKTAAEADTILYNRITRFMEGSIRLGVSRDDIYVDMISQVPIYEYEVEKKRFSKNYTEVPRGIEVQRNLHVRFTDSRILERLVSLAAQNQIYDLVKVEYFVENPQAIYDSLRQEAIKLLNKTIKDYKALGVDLSESYRMFSEQKGVVYPFDRYENYEGFASSSVDALRKRDAITKVYKPKTFYYNKLSESNFDIVMHASIIEPVIQYTYSIHIRLDTPQRPVKEAKPTPPKPQIITKTQTIKESEFFLVTPDGKVQTLLKTQSDR